MQINIFWYIVVGMAGLVAGSFLNSVIYRIDDLSTIMRHRSHCPHCKKEIRWYDLIPLLSFVALKGRCRQCGEEISLRYPIVELGTALLFMALLSQFGLSWYALILMVISCFLVVIFATDLKEMIIPDVALFPALVVWIVVWLLAVVPGVNMGLPMGFLDYLYGALLAGGFIGLIVLITKGKGMGMGDIKLALLLGFMLGWQIAIVGLFFAFVIGSIIAVILLIFKIKKLKSEVPFGPFLIIGFYIALFWGERIIQWYIR